MNTSRTVEPDSPPPSGPAPQLLGLALGPHSLTAVEAAGTRFGSRPGRVWRYEIEVGQNVADGGVLREILEELRVEAGIGSARIHAVLLPPLARVRRIHVPGLRSRELRRSVARDTHRFFPVPAGCLNADIVWERKRSAPRRDTALVHAANARVAVALFNAVDETGFGIDTVTSGPAAMAAGATALLPAVRRGTAALLRADQDSVELWLLRRGILRLWRRRPLKLDSAVQCGSDVCARLLLEAEQAVGTHATHIVILGAAPGVSAESIRARLDDRTVSITEYSVMPPGAMEAFGAACTSTTRLPDLRPEEPRARDRRRARHRTAALAAVAAVLLAIAGSIHVHSAATELDRLLAVRKANEPFVETALEARATLEVLDELLARLTEIENSGPHWIDTFDTLATHLPADAFLAGVRQQPDGTVIIHGSAADPRSVTDALLEAPGIIRADPHATSGAASGTGNDFSLALTFAGGPDGERDETRAAQRDRKEEKPL